MIYFEIEGLEDIQSTLEKIEEVASGNWAGPVGALGEKLRRYAVAISPVITGSYQRAHRVAISDKQAVLSIDPGARNVVSGALVSTYAPSVEQRHNIYSRAYGQIGRFAVELENEMYEEMEL